MSRCMTNDASRGFWFTPSLAGALRKPAAFAKGLISTAPRFRVREAAPDHSGGSQVCYPSANRDGWGWFVRKRRPQMRAATSGCHQPHGAEFSPRLYWGVAEERVIKLIVSPFVPTGGALLRIYLVLLFAGRTSWSILFGDCLFDPIRLQPASG